MQNIDLTDAEILKPLTEFDTDNVHIDLHNDYNCIKINFSKSENIFIIEFNSIIIGTINSILVKFKDAVVKKACLPLQSDFPSELTIDTFYRGRFENEGRLREYSDTKQGYYYISFDEDYFIELFASSVICVLADDETNYSRE